MLLLLSLLTSRTSIRSKLEIFKSTEWIKNQIFGSVFFFLMYFMFWMFNWLTKWKFTNLPFAYDTHVRKLFSLICSRHEQWQGNNNKMNGNTSKTSRAYTPPKRNQKKASNKLKMQWEIHARDIPHCSTYNLNCRAKFLEPNWFYRI